MTIIHLHLAQSIGSGRPMTFPSSVVDCELPEDKDATVGDDGRQIPSCAHLLFYYLVLTN